MSCKNSAIALFAVTYCVLPFSGAATRKNDDAENTNDGNSVTENLRHFKID